jgi:hypothetical protein
MPHRSWSEAARRLLLLAAGLILMCPFATRNLVGGGDMLHYVRQLDDFRAQVSAGVFPVMVGQSEHAFNGDIHPLRTAPYFQHFGELLNLLTGSELPASLLLNITLIIHLIAGGFSAYACLGVLVPERRWTALLLALLYIASPGVLAMIYGGDLVISWMTLPWLPPFYLGVIGAARDPRNARAWLAAAIALAALWLAHAPIAFWAMVTGIPFGIAALVRCREGKAADLLIPAGAATVFVLLSGYVFASVLYLNIPTDPNMRLAVARGSVFDALQRGWAGFLRPVSPSGAALLSDIQLSPGLWAAGLLGLAGLWRRERRLAVPFAVVLLGALALLAPIPALAGRVWPNMPAFVLGITDEWPMLRIYVLLSAIVPFLAALGLAALGPVARRIALVLLAAGVAWSGWDARKFIQRGWAITSPPLISTLRQLPENALLSRYSYEYYGHLPRYFSTGASGPWLQNRLLDADTLEPDPASLAKIASRAPANAERHELVDTVYGGIFLPPLAISPGQLYLVDVDFKGTMPTGTLEILGDRVYREFGLPASGEERAFGAGPGRPSGFALQITGDRVDTPETKFIRSPGAGAMPAHMALRLIPLRGEDLPVEVRSLIPYRLAVRSPRPAWVETPKIFLPGYAATVDGAGAGIASSPDGLVMVRVPAGRSEVVLSYPGPPGLRAVFWVTAAAWAALAAGWIWAKGFARKRPEPSAGSVLPAFGRAGLVALAAVAIVTGVAEGWSAVRSTPNLTPGRIVLSFTFPYGKEGTTEPLLTIGTGDDQELFFANYADGKNVRIGCVTAKGAPFLSGRIPVNYLARQRLEIDPSRPDSGEPTMADVRLNQRLVLKVAAIPEAPDLSIAAGRNLLPQSGIPSAFNGRIIYVTRPR